MEQSRKDALKKKYWYFFSARDWIDKFIFRKLINQQRWELEKVLIGKVNSVLDLGCGSHSDIGYFKKKIDRTVGVDLFLPSLNISQKNQLHHEYHKMDILNAAEYFGENSFDCVVALDVIEHLEKADGLRLLKQMEIIARKKVIIFTPNGFLEQKPFDGNEWQRHISGWEVDEMRQLGFEIIGINGWKALRGERAKITIRPISFWKRISYLSGLFVTKNPKFAFQILCIKNL